MSLWMGSGTAATNWEALVPRRYGMLRRSKDLARCKGLPPNHQGYLTKCSRTSEAMTCSYSTRFDFTLFCVSEWNATLCSIVIIARLDWYYHSSYFVKTI
ncbi:hypothetical protein AVEN_10617-1 [Araneus ventricosus]|uniref:Uncharacterized protein n=1 Tax=Araneus ventricosus TaxID=182803 RepID=A0A4Y2PLZ0_ARAVE|nr:hypothetical protein AVEN_195017-1 [Araneus ventricosus]GBN52975.1 hypothetical protein AVEN_191750-1 [Araneus ventricosus]GBN53646.1 hypothetical protein AVEN_266857-1 [Araneus ventricosus]GBN53681.1 hypothetical protein AVEN_10617-1 [Araneus ventricosus]